jgi:hypothetical protein
MVALFLFLKLGALAPFSYLIFKKSYSFGVSFSESWILDKIEGRFWQRNSRGPRVERWAGLGGGSCKGGW